MKLGINGWRIHGQRTGIGRYLCNVVRHWTIEGIAGRFDEVNFYTQKPVDRRDILLPANIRERVVGPDWRLLLWENLRLGPAAADQVLFCPSYSRPLFAHGKTVVAMFDATLHLHPELYPFSARIVNDPLYGWSVRNSALVITGSETARDDIVRSYRVPHSRIRVVPLAPSEVFKPHAGDPRVARTVARYLGAPVPYFLFVGKLSARRNVPKLMEAFAEMKRRLRVPHKLLIVGLNTTDLNLADLSNRLGIAADFKHSSYVPDEDLTMLYNGAVAFVIPYTYEAVSLTALEAQATGTPVIIVDTPGLHETTGGIALHIPRPEVPEIVEALTRLATDAHLRLELSNKGLAHAQRFTWRRCADETLNVLEEAVRQPVMVRG